MAQRLYGPKDLRWMEIEVPELLENEVLIRIKYSTADYLFNIEKFIFS